MTVRTVKLFIILAVVVLSISGASDPGGFNGAFWGQPPDQVKTAVKATGWQPDQLQQKFPPELKVTVFRTTGVVAGYNAIVQYYFQDNRFFQATVDFPFPDLVNFDFNYNVYRSVSEYYTAIRTKTLLFVDDIYALLYNKYGKKKPVFKGLDPRFIFQELDHYVMRERWNLRYNPYDFYQNIVTSSYARWDFPHTQVFFSVNIAAEQKRFDYRLSLASVDMSETIRKAMNIVRAQGL